MKKDQKSLTYHPDAKIICACGNQMTIGSTVPEIHVELCSNCHPFFTGKEKVVDTAGRVDRFKKLSEKKSAAPARRKMQDRLAKIREREATEATEEKVRQQKIKAAKKAAKEEATKAAAATKAAKAETAATTTTATEAKQ